MECSLRRTSRLSRVCCNRTPNRVRSTSNSLWSRYLPVPAPASNLSKSSKDCLESQMADWILTQRRATSPSLLKSYWRWAKLQVMKPQDVIVVVDRLNDEIEDINQVTMRLARPDLTDTPEWFLKHSLATHPKYSNSSKPHPKPNLLQKQRTKRWNCAPTTASPTYSIKGHSSATLSTWRCTKTSAVAAKSKNKPHAKTNSANKSSTYLGSTANTRLISIGMPR